MNNKEVSECFKNGKSAKSQNMFSEGNDIYSYGYHFRIASRIAHDTYLFNPLKYSNSTAKHCNHVRSALRNATLIYVKNADMKYLDFQIEENLRQIQILETKFLRARTENSKRFLKTEIQNLKEQNKLIFELSAKKMAIFSNHSYIDLDDDQINAIVEFLEKESLEVDDITDISDKSDYGLIIKAGHEYLLMTDEEADEYAVENIRQSVWAFNPEFLQGHLKGNLDLDILKMIQEKCEGANYSLLNLLENFEHFKNDAISLDGRGHFLNSYDGDEHELKNGYVYIRTN